MVSASELSDEPSSFQKSRRKANGSVQNGHGSQRGRAYPRVTRLHPRQPGGKRAPVAASNGQQERSNQPGRSAGWSLPAAGGQTACLRLEGWSKKQEPLGKPGERLTLTRDDGR